MNTQPTENALLRANLLGFVTQVKAAADASGAPITDAEVGQMHKRASAFISGRMEKLAKLTAIVREHIKVTVPVAA